METVHILDLYVCGHKAVSAIVNVHCSIDNLATAITVLPQLRLTRHTIRDDVIASMVIFSRADSKLFIACYDKRT